MSDGEAEYEVEQIHRARLVKTGRKRAWQYDVKWKGYDAKDNTWEPASSFGGSEHFIEAFWARLHDKRDYTDLTLFKDGEILFPKGPPRKSKPKGKAKADSQPEVASSVAPQVPHINDRDHEIIADSESEVQSARPSSRSNTRKRPASEDEDDAPVVKRRRGRAPKASRPEEDGAESVSAPPRPRKKRPVAKLPRIPAVKTKASPAKSINAPLDASTGAQSYEPKPASKEPSLDLPLIHSELLVDESSSDVDRALVVETLDAGPDTFPDDSDRAHVIESPDAGHHSSPDDGSLFGGSDVDMQESASTAVQTITVPSPISALPSPLSAKIPAHRARAANPRIKIMDDSFTDRSGLSVKAALTRPVAGDTEGSNGAESQKPRSPVVLSNSGQGDSPRTIYGSTSVLTAGKNGALYTRRKQAVSIPVSSQHGITNAVGSNGIDEDNAHASSVEAIDSSIPTASEVLQLAGLEAAVANALPDFDDTSDQDAEGESDHDHAHSQHGSYLVGHLDIAPEPLEVPQAADPAAVVTLNADQPIKDALAAASAGSSDVIMMQVTEEPASVIVAQKPLLNPPTALIGRDSSNNVTISASAAWKHTTIFGPLSSGRSVPPTPLEVPSASQQTSNSPTLLIVLGPAVDLPVVLKDIHPARTPSLKPLDSIVSGGFRGVPGKFYKGDNAAGLVSAFGVEGSCARIVQSASADALQKHNFERFSSLLRDGAIFVLTVGSHTLAFSSSENVNLSTKLGMSPNLIGLGNNILVTEVVIDNDALYFKCIGNIEDERW
ncbi:hypothetical protein BC835DRAFT_1421523 [Cytidiella melzeri]|nr:hypothetical protein BC835DRAFT_1421523 [Cytidiella melzeri]